MDFYRVDRMFQQNKFVSTSYQLSALKNKGAFKSQALNIFSVAVIYLLSVLFLVLLTKMSFASPALTTAIVEQADVVASDYFARIVAGFLGMLVAVAFFLASKREAHKLLH
jgi:hypothetical protein